MTASGIFAVLCLPSPVTSLDDFGTLFVQKLMAAIGAEELDLLAPKFLIVAIKFTFALRAGHPENFGHNSSRYTKKIRNSKHEIRNKSQPDKS
jgi:hypothetical protein